MRLKNKMFYVGFMLYSIPTILQTTMLVEDPVLDRIFVWTRYFAFATGFLLLALRQAAELRADRQRGEGTALRVLGWKALLLLIAGISAAVSDDYALLACIIFIMAAEEIDPEEIIRATLFMLIASVSFVLLFCAAGMIPDLLFKRQDIPIRHTFGFDYPSTLMSFLFFIVAIYLWTVNMKIDALRLFVIEAVNYVFFRFTDSRAAFLSIALLAAAAFLGDLQAVRQAKEKLRGICETDTARALTDHFGCVLTLITAVLGVLLPTGIGQRLDQLLTGRLQYIAAGVQNYGIHLFGKRIQWVGFGGSYDTDSLLEEYNYIDNSYAQILIKYGILALLLVLFMLWFMNRRVRKEYSLRRLILILGVLSYCFIEPRLTDIYIDPFLFLTAPLLCGKVIRGKYRKI